MEHRLINRNVNKVNQSSAKKNASKSKLALKDTTNVGKEEKKSPKVQDLKKEEDDDLDYFQHPKNSACYCCGNKRKLDGELLFSKLIDPAFLKMLDDNLRMPECESEPWSPIERKYFPDWQSLNIPSPHMSPPSPGSPIFPLPLPEEDFPLDDNGDDIKSSPNK